MDDVTVRAARSEYFARSGFAADGGYGERWVKLKIGRFALYFLNTAARVRAVKLHDIHHVLTAYDTTWTGEAEIAAWEIASGCGRHYPAWLLNLGALAIGLLIAPRRTFRAFVRGSRSRNLYAGQFSDALLDMPVSALRRDLAIAADGRGATPREMLRFVGWAGVAVAVTAAPYVAGIGAALIIWRHHSA